MTSADGAEPSGLPRDGRLFAAALVRIIGAAALLLTGYFLLPIDKDSSANTIGLVVGAGLLFGFCVWEVRRFYRSHHPVVAAAEMLVALITFYITAFATVYFLLADYRPGSFTEHLTRVDALYFCLTVFTTTGFGDIAADSQPARVMVSVQMASTLIIVGFGLRLLKLMITDRKRANG